MSGEVAQDIDSGTGAVITPGEAVKHVDMEDGQSVGHSAEPEIEAQPAPVRAPRDEPPPRVSRDDIYAKAKTGRAAEIDGDIAEMSDEQRRQHARMIAEAGGGPDPYADDDEAVPDYAQARTPAKEVTGKAEKTPVGIDAGSETTTITVYGMREEVPTAQINAAGGLDVFQKMRAADVRLSRLATFEASLRGWETQLSERAAKIERGSQSPASTGTGESESSTTDALGNTADVGALAATVTEAFYSGDREEATSKLSEVLASIRTDAVRAAQRVAVPSVPSGPSQTELDREAAARAEANAVFRNEFPDLNTPVLRQAALNMVGEVARDPVMSGRPLAEITREACSRIATEVFPDHPRPVATANKETAVKQKNPVIPAAPPVDLSSRYAMKRRTVVRPVNEAHGRVISTKTDEQPFLSNTDFVAQLRKGRGQPV